MGALRISIGAIFLIPTLWGMMVALGGLAGLVGWDWFAFQVGYAAGYAIVQPYVWAGGDDYWTAKILTMVFTHGGICGAMAVIGSAICGWAFKGGRDSGRQDTTINAVAERSA